MKSSLTVGPLLAALAFGLVGNAQANKSVGKKEHVPLVEAFHDRGLSQSANKHRAALIPTTGQERFNRVTVQMVKG